MLHIVRQIIPVIGKPAAAAAAAVPVRETNFVNHCSTPPFPTHSLPGVAKDQISVHFVLQIKHLSY
jgi:hypothetical protein